MRVFKHRPPINTSTVQDKWTPDLRVISKHDTQSDDYRACTKIINVMSPNVLSNPFIVDKQRNNIDNVLEKFNTHLRKLHSTNFAINESIRTIIRLLKSGHIVGILCCCAPNKCHGDVLKKFILELIENENY